jgi:uncharacterized SAM-binding protein YcdF (DUF218 family)
MVTAIVVPGNGSLARDGVYRISGRCRRVVAAAEAIADEVAPRVVVFSGWSPAGGEPEAEQMRAAWRGREVELLAEPTARTTAENAARTLPLLLERGIARAIVVCAPLHVPRVRFFFRGLYGPRGIDTEFRAARVAPSPYALAWEVGALAVRRPQLRAAEAELSRRP